jgi:hypothetical protein
LGTKANQDCDGQGLRPKTKSRRPKDQNYGITITP